MIFARPLTWAEWILWCFAEEPWRIDPRSSAPEAPPPAPAGVEEADV
jgi:hypothetical protein